MGADASAGLRAPDKGFSDAALATTATERRARISGRLETPFFKPRASRAGGSRHDGGAEAAQSTHHRKSHDDNVVVRRMPLKEEIAERGKRRKRKSK
jgi:hypothetical protein